MVGRVMTHIGSAGFEFIIHKNSDPTSVDQGSVASETQPVMNFVEFLKQSDVSVREFYQGHEVPTPSAGVGKKPVSNAIRFDALGLWGLSHSINHTPDATLSPGNSEPVPPQDQAGPSPQNYNLADVYGDLLEGYAATREKSIGNPVDKNTQQTQTIDKSRTMRSEPRSMVKPMTGKTNATVPHVVTSNVTINPLAVVTTADSIELQNTPKTANISELVDADIEPHLQMKKSAALTRLQTLSQTSSMQIALFVMEQGLRFLARIPDMSTEDMNSLRRNLKDLITGFGITDAEIVLESLPDPQHKQEQE